MVVISDYSRGETLVLEHFRPFFLTCPALTFFFSFYIKKQCDVISAFILKSSFDVFF